jgi:hypothetical protein
MHPDSLHPDSIHPDRTRIDLRTVKEPVLIYGL